MLYTSNQIASKNIADALSALRINAIDTKAPTVLDVPTRFDTDYILVLSSHKSKVPKPMLTMHFPGNWGKAEMGGSSQTLNIAYASKLRQLYLETKKANAALGLNWDVVVEVDHHGPTCNVPIIFIEIGSSEKEWVNPLAAKVLAEAIREVLRLESSVLPSKTKGDKSELKTQDSKRCMDQQDDIESARPRTFFGIGCGHYAREFCAFMERAEGKDWAVGHMLPKYAIDGASDDVLKQAIEKSVEKVEKAIALKDSLNQKQKEKIRKFCEQISLAYSEI